VVIHELAEKRFARSVYVKVGGVDEIAARLAEGIVHLLASSLAEPQPHSSPKVMVPSAASETRSPELPNSRYRIEISFSVREELGAR
jgi:hypothetical protein